jgi:hypothetical protein
VGKVDSMELDTCIFPIHLFAKSWREVGSHRGHTSWVGQACGKVESLELGTYIILVWIVVKSWREVGNHRGHTSWVGQACGESRVCKIFVELGTCIEILLLLRDL